jgi:hypothetical protein
VDTLAETGGPYDCQKLLPSGCMIFAVVAALQLIRAVNGWPITVGATTSIPLWASWVVCVIAGVLAWIGFDASR